MILDALNRQSDYLRLYMMQELTSHEKYVFYMKEYLKKNILSKNEYNQMIELKTSHFVLTNEQLMRKISEEALTLYLK